MSGTRAAPKRTTKTVERRVDDIDWSATGCGLDEVGIAAMGPELSVTECDQLVRLYRDDDRFRSTIDMARHRYGHGQYRYFSNPRPTSFTNFARRSAPSVADRSRLGHAP